MAIDMLKPLVQKNIILSSKPDGGFFMFLKTDYDDATSLCMDILEKAKVGVIPGKSFGPDGASCLRLCYAREPEVLREGITRFLNYFLIGDH